MSHDLPVGIWDNPDPQDMPVYSAFVKAWHDDSGENLTLSALAYGDAAYGDDLCEVSRGETRHTHNYNSSSIGIAGQQGEFSEGAILIACVSCSGQSITGFTPDKEAWQMISSPLDIDDITTQAFWRRADGDSFYDSFTADGIKDDISLVVTTYQGIDSILTTQTISETGTSGATSLTISPLPDYDDYPDCQILLFAAISNTQAYTWDGSANDPDFSFVVKNDTGRDSDIVLFQQYLETSIDGTTGVVQNDIGENITLNLTGTHGSNIPYCNGYVFILKKNDCTCQYGRPIADESLTGDWINSDDNTSDLFSYIDNGNIQDGTYIKMPAAGTGTLDVNVNNITHWNNEGWEYHFRAKLSTAGTRGVRVDLMQAGGTISSGSSSYFDLTDEWQEYAWEVDPSEADYIVDGNDLRIRFQANNSGDADILISRAFVVGPCPDIEASGGIVVGGTANPSKLVTAETTGGMVAGGTSTSSVFINVEGGVVGGGNGDLHYQASPITSGGVEVGGAANPSKLMTAETTGGMVAGGTSTSSVFINAQGGVVGSGTGDLRYQASPITTGGAEAGGVSSVQSGLIGDDAGVVLGGTSALSVVKNPDSTGGLEIGGTASKTTFVTETPSGGLTVCTSRFSNGYLYRTSITIPAAKLNSDLSSFTVGAIIDLPENVSSTFQVTDMAGNVKDHEVREHSENSVWIYFRTDLSSSTDNQFYLYSGGSE